MAWYDKYVSGQAGMGGNQYTPEQAIGIRQMEFDQRMAERKATDKYERKMARKERIRNRPRGSFKQKRKRAHWNWLADLERKSPQAAAYYRYTQERKGARSRWKAEQKRRRRAGALQRSAGGDKAKQQWVGQMGGAQGSRHREYPGPMPAVKVGKSGAPQFMSLASMGYKSPGQLGFKTYTGQPNYRYTPRGTSARGGRRRSQGQGEGQAERYFDWDTMQWVTPQEPKQKKGRGTRPRRQAPRVWAEGRREKNLPSDYGAYLKDRRARSEAEAKRQAEAYRSRPEFFDATTPPLDRRTGPSMMDISVLTGGGRPAPLRPVGWAPGTPPMDMPPLAPPPRPLLDPIRSGGGLVPVDSPPPTARPAAPPSGPGYAGAGWTSPGTGWTPPPPSGLMPNLSAINAARHWTPPPGPDQSYGHDPISASEQERLHQQWLRDQNEEWANSWPRKNFWGGLWNFATGPGPERDGPIFHDLLGRPIKWLP